MEDEGPHPKCVSNHKLETSHPWHGATLGIELLLGKIVARESLERHVSSN